MGWDRDRCLLLQAREEGATPAPPACPESRELLPVRENTGAGRAIPEEPMA